MSFSGTCVDPLSTTMSDSRFSYGLFDGVDWGQRLFGDFEMDQVKGQSIPQNTMASQQQLRPITKAIEETPDSSPDFTPTTDFTPTLPVASTCRPTSHFTWPLSTSPIPTAPISTATPSRAVASTPDQWSPGTWRKRHLTPETPCSSDGGPGQGGGWTRQCVFCKRNGETREFYTTHVLKDRRGMVICPVLRAYTCPKCGASGDFAHTDSHCPLTTTRSTQPSLMNVLRTRRSSCGKKIYYSDSCRIP